MYTNKVESIYFFNWCQFKISFEKTVSGGPKKPNMFTYGPRTHVNQNCASEMCNLVLDQSMGLIFCMSGKPGTTTNLLIGQEYKLHS